MNEQEHNRYSPPTAPVGIVMDTASRAFGVRFFAALLVIGGICGIGLSLYMAYSFAQQNRISAAFGVAFLALFIWSVLTGLRLWRGDPRGVKWSKILFASQIPVIALPGVSYEYFTGISARILAVGGDLFAIKLGASAELYLGTNVTGGVLGVNVFAIIAFVYLMRKLKPNTAIEATREDAST